MDVIRVRLNTDDLKKLGVDYVFSSEELSEYSLEKIATANGYYVYRLKDE